ncbi:MAG: 30S ribosomal protein S5 [Candidatus Omnitrophica bacterium]|nr:30S ribosomal protein S5 [Candidatus Omnitrophota bacterium]
MADIEKDLKRKKKNLPVVIKGKDRNDGVVEEVTTGEDIIAAPAEAQGQGRKPQAGKRPPRRREIEPSEFIEKVLAIKRVTKVTKGGKKIAFSALVVVGNEQGKVGFAVEKAGEVATAIKKSLGKAKKNMIQIPLKGTTIPHEIIGCCGAARVLLKPAADGTGVIASGAIRAVCDGAGIRNILTKCHRSNNPLNVVKATFDGLTRLKIAHQSFDRNQESALVGAGTPEAGPAA